METDAYIDAIVSHAMSTGQFERVNQYEPKKAPGNGLTAAVWFQSLVPTRIGGLDSTTVRLVMRIRIYTSMLMDPPDQIDPNVIEALDVLLNAYSGDFTLDGLIRNVDLLGQSGTPMQADAGYLNQDGKMMRIVDITLPMIINDVWEQVP